MNINCTQLYFVESIRKNFIVTDVTDSYCNGGLHSLFTSCSGLRSVSWTIMIKKCWGNNVAAFAKLSHVTLYGRTATDGNMSVVENGFFAVATYWRKYLSIREVRWFEVGYCMDITE